MAAFTSGVGSGLSGLEGSDALLAVRFVRHLGLNQNTVYIFSTGLICRMRRRLLKCHSQVSIWVNVNIDAAFMVLCTYRFPYSVQPPAGSARSIDSSGTDERKQPDAWTRSGTQFGLVCGVDSWLPNVAGQSSRNRMFWAWFGRLSKLAGETIGNFETQ